MGARGTVVSVAVVSTGGPGQKCQNIPATKSPIWGLRPPSPRTSELWVGVAKCQMPRGLPESSSSPQRFKFKLMEAFLKHLVWICNEHLLALQ